MNAELTDGEYTRYLCSMMIDCPSVKQHVLRYFKLYTYAQIDKGAERWVDAVDRPVVCKTVGGIFRLASSRGTSQWHPLIDEIWDNLTIMPD